MSYHLPPMTYEVPERSEWDHPEACHREERSDLSTVIARNEAISLLSSRACDAISLYYDLRMDTKNL